MVPRNVGGGHTHAHDGIFVPLGLGLDPHPRWQKLIHGVWVLAGAQTPALCVGGGTEKGGWW